jgi:hypothetical protein
VAIVMSNPLHRVLRDAVYRRDADGVETAPSS